MSLSHGGGGHSLVSSQYLLGTFIWVGISKTSLVNRFFVGLLPILRRNQSELRSVESHERLNCVSIPHLLYFISKIPLACQGVLFAIEKNFSDGLNF
jgi:hypothetical protein